MEPGTLDAMFLFLIEDSVHEAKSSLTFDEMSIKTGLQYDISSSYLCGDVTLPDHNRIATYICSCFRNNNTQEANSCLSL